MLLLISILVLLFIDLALPARPKAKFELRLRFLDHELADIVLLPFHCSALANIRKINRCLVPILIGQF